MNRSSDLGLVQGWLHWLTLGGLAHRSLLRLTLRLTLRLLRLILRLLGLNLRLLGLNLRLLERLNGRLLHLILLLGLILRLLLLILRLHYLTLGIHVHLTLRVLVLDGRLSHLDHADPRLRDHRGDGLPASRVAKNKHPTEEVETPRYDLFAHSVPVYPMVAGEKMGQAPMGQVYQHQEGH